MGSVTMWAGARVRLGVALVTAAAVLASTGMPGASTAAAPPDAAAESPTGAAPDLRWGAEVGYLYEPLAMDVGGDGTTVVGAGEGVVQAYDDDGSPLATITTNTEVRDLAVDDAPQFLAAAATPHDDDLVIDGENVPLGAPEAVFIVDGEDRFAWPVVGGIVERVEWVGDDIVLLAEAWSGEVLSINGHELAPLSPEDRLVLARIDAATGTPVWSLPFDGSASNRPRLGVGDGGVAVVLHVPSGLSVLQFSLAGALERTRDVTIPAGFLEVRSVGVGPTGEVVIGGQGSSEETRVLGGSDGSDLGGVRGMFALRIDGAGEPSWLRTGATAWQSRIEDLAVASDGTVVVTGSTSAIGFVEVNAGPGGKSFVAALGADGGLRWVDRLGPGGRQRIGLDADDRPVVGVVTEGYTDVPALGRPPAVTWPFDGTLALVAYSHTATPCQPDLHIEATIEPEDVDLGTPMSLAVRLTNDGSCAAQVPLVQPDRALPWVGLTQGYGFDEYGVWHVGNLEPGATAEAWFEVGTADITEPITVRVLPWPGDPDPNPTNDVATTVPECADLEPSVSVTPTSTEWTPTGVVGAVEVTVTNVGTCDLDDQASVRVEAPYLTGATPSVGSVVSDATSVVWTFDALPAGEQVTLAADLSVPATLIPMSHVVRVWVDEPTWDTTYLSTTFTVVPRCADLRLGLSATPSPVLVGETVRFRLEVTNAGTCDLDTASSVSLQGPLLDEVIDVPALAVGESAVVERDVVATLDGPEAYAYRSHTASIGVVGDPATGNSATAAVWVVRPAVITGVVTGPDGQPASGVVVQAFTPSGPLIPASASAVTDAEGRYRIEGPVFGPHKLYALDLRGRFHGSWFGAAASRPASPTVSTTWGSVVEVGTQLEARAPGSVVVDVVDAGGDPRPAVWVSVFDTDGHVRSGRTESDGRVALRDLEPGTYWVRAVPLDDPGATEWWRNQISRGTARPLVVADGPVLVSVQLDR